MDHLSASPRLPASFLHATTTSEIEDDQPRAAIRTNKRIALSNLTESLNPRRVASIDPSPFDASAAPPCENEFFSWLRRMARLSHNPSSEKGLYPKQRNNTEGRERMRKAVIGSESSDKKNRDRRSGRERKGLTSDHAKRGRCMDELDSLAGEKITPSNGL